MQSLKNHLPRHKYLTAVALWFLAAAQAHAVEITVPLPGRVDNYAECVLDAVGPDLDGVALHALTSDCRTRFPEPSRPGLLGPGSVESCYQKHEDRIASREVAKVVFSACQDYFRADARNNPSALRGSRLQPQ